MHRMVLKVGRHGGIGFRSSNDHDGHVASTRPTESSDDPAIHTIRGALDRLSPAGVSVDCWHISAQHAANLRPTELLDVESAVETRRAEFATGRALLRDLCDLDVAIPIGANGAPKLPPGVVGSLAHDRNVVVAAVARRPDIVAIGIDIEPPNQLDADEAAIIVGPNDIVADALTAFVQKEAVYKAWSSLGGRMLEHHEVVLQSDAEGFSARVEPDGAEFHGAHTLVDGIRLALVVVLHRAP